MGDRDLPSDSDSSDEDFVPEGIEKEQVSEDESADDSNNQEDSEGENTEQKKKRKKNPTKKRTRKKLKSNNIEENCEEEKKEEKSEISVEDKKQKADALWADFLKGSDTSLRKKSDVPHQVIAETSKIAEEQTTKAKIVEEFHFAGEKVLIEKDVGPTKNGTLTSNSTSSSTPAPTRGRGRGRGSGGMASVLGQLGKKNKLSTLEKSKLDWNTFKKDEGIEEEIKQHNMGKNGYLERQDFLERADLRQFEIEKSMREAKRSSLR